MKKFSFFFSSLNPLHSLVFSSFTPNTSSEFPKRVTKLAKCRSRDLTTLTSYKVKTRYNILYTFNLKILNHQDWFTL
jgi:hypothetical protein